MNLPFVKMHGLGNDFVVVDSFYPFSAYFTDLKTITPVQAQKICDRRFGIGCDQILWLKKPVEQGQVRMEILNSDGSAAEMCGNGIRAVALYLQKHDPARSNRYEIETLAGLKIVEIEEGLVNVDMGPPQLGSHDGEMLAISGEDFHFYEVGMGNPHAVIFSDRVEGVFLEVFGPMIERHLRFPQRTNVEFVQVINKDKIQVRVWERGAGITLACGTGACASAVAAILTGKVNTTVEVALPGGTLTITWNKDPRSSVMMKGPAVEVFSGEIQL